MKYWNFLGAVEVMTQVESDQTVKASIGQLTVVLKGRARVFNYWSPNPCCPESIETEKGRGLSLLLKQIPANDREEQKYDHFYTRSQNTPIAPELKVRDVRDVNLKWAFVPYCGVRKAHIPFELYGNLQENWQGLPVDVGTCNFVHGRSNISGNMKSFLYPTFPGEGVVKGVGKFEDVDVFLKA
jgi:hypothetical protein